MRRDVAQEQRPDRNVAVLEETLLRGSVAIGRPGQRYPGRQHLLRAETGVFVNQSNQAASDERCSNEQHDRERQLAQNERIAEARTCGRPVSRFSTRWHSAAARSAGRERP